MKAKINDEVIDLDEIFMIKSVFAVKPIQMFPELHSYGSHQFIMLTKKGQSLSVTSEPKEKFSQTKWEKLSENQRNSVLRETRNRCETAREQVIALWTQMGNLKNIES